MPKNKSEILLEGYLRSRGMTDFEFEPVLTGTSRRPDYRLSTGRGDLLLEVKEFAASPIDIKSGFGVFDPYPPLREKINAASRKFKDLSEHACCLVLYNLNRPFILLDWKHIYGAMLGNLGFSLPIRIERESSPIPENQIRQVFTFGGKMHRESKGAVVAPQNRTISAIIVLGRVAAGRRLLHAHLKRQEALLGRRFDFEELAAELKAHKGTGSDPRHRPLRVTVHENPYARMPVPRDLFRGPYDERYGESDGRIQQLFVGEQLVGLPSET